MGTSKLLWGQPDKMLLGNLRGSSIPSRGSRNTPSRFILQKPEISAGTDEPLARPFPVGMGQTLSHDIRELVWWVIGECVIFARMLNF